jgi:hypothetical protein
MRKVLLLTVASLAVAASAYGNLVTNPGFETGDLTGWQTWRAGWSVGDTISANTAQKAFGAYCMRIQFSNGEGSHGIYQVVPVTANLEHDFSTWVRANVNSANWSEVLLYNYAVTDSDDIDSGAKSAPYLIWKRDSWNGVAGTPGGMLPTVATVPGPGNAWEYVTGSVASPTGYVTIAYKWGRSGEGFSGGMFVDDVSLTPIPEPATLLALGLGLAGLAIRRRR